MYRDDNMAFLTVLPDPSNKRSYWGAADSSGDAGPGFASVKLTSDQKIMMSRTNSQRVISRAAAGQKWNIDIGYHPMTRAEFNPVYTFLLQQRGPLTPFYVELPQYASSQNALFNTDTNESGEATYNTNTFAAVGAQAAGATSVLLTQSSGWKLKNAAGADITTSNTTDIPFNIPAVGDVCTFNDSTNTNHKKVYMVTYIETYWKYNIIPQTSSDQDADERTIRVGITPPLSKSVAADKTATFKGVQFKVILPSAVREYSLGTDNLYKFNLKLEEYL